MARRSTSGWEIVGGLIGVGLAAGLAYTVHTKMQEAVNHMLSVPLDQALQELAASVPSLEEEVWDIFVGALRSRANQSLRARQLLAFAADVRETAPHLLRLLHLPGDRAVSSVFDITLDLNDSSWQVFQLTMAGFAQHSEYAETLLHFALRVRKANKAIELLLEKATTERLGLLIHYTQELDDNEWGIFRAVLNNGAKRRQVQELLDIATLTRDLQTQVQQIAHNSLDGAIQRVIEIAPHLNDFGWSLLTAMLTQAAETKPLLRLLLPTLDDTREAVAYADKLLMYPLHEAQHMLAAELHTRPDTMWPTLRIVLVMRGQTSTKAQRLADHAETVHRDAVISALPALPAPQPTPSDPREVKEEIRTHARIILADGVITLQEQTELDALRDKLQVSSELVDHILEEIRQERVGTASEEASMALPEWITAPLPDEQFRTNLREALSDNVITPEEGRALEQLRRRLQLSTTQAQQLLREVQAEQMAKPKPAA